VEYLSFVNDDTKFWFTFDNFKLNAFKITMYDKCVTLFYWSKIILELSFDISVEKVSCDSLNTIREGKYVYLLTIW
jgi:hypothetical protein